MIQRAAGETRWSALRGLRLPQRHARHRSDGGDDFDGDAVDEGDYDLLGEEPQIGGAPPLPRMSTTRRAAAIASVHKTTKRTRPMTWLAVSGREVASDVMPTLI